MKWHQRATLRRFSHRLGPCEVEETVIMLFSGAAISLAARGHWVSERGRPALLPVCPPASHCLPTLTPTCLSAWLHVCFSACQIISWPHSLVYMLPRVFPPACACGRMGAPPGIRRLSDTARHLIGGCGRPLGLVLSPSAAQFLLLLVVKPKYPSFSSSPPTYFFFFCQVLNKGWPEEGKLDISQSSSSSSYSSLIVVFSFLSYHPILLLYGGP